MSKNLYEGFARSKIFQFFFVKNLQTVNIDIDENVSKICEEAMKVLSMRNHVKNIFEKNERQPSTFRSNLEYINDERFSSRKVGNGVSLHKRLEMEFKNHEAQKKTEEAMTNQGKSLAFPAFRIDRRKTFRLFERSTLNFKTAPFIAWLKYFTNMSNKMRFCFKLGDLLIFRKPLKYEYIQYIYNIITNIYKYIILGILYSFPSLLLSRLSIWLGFFGLPIRPILGCSQQSAQISSFSRGDFA
jgi:hypothetical protein